MTGALQCRFRSEALACVQGEGIRWLCMQGTPFARIRVACRVSNPTWIVDTMACE